jgi:Xaa-Pro aminopeptidase
MKDPMMKRYQERIKRVIRQLTEEDAALVLSTPAAIRQSRGVMVPFRQESDLSYLTGFKGHDLTVVITGKDKKITFLAPKQNPQRILWEGKDLDFKPLARALKGEIVESDQIETEVLKRLRGVDRLYYQSRPNSIGNQVATKLFALDSYVRGNYPAHFSAADALLAPMRLIKSPEEVSLIIKAGEITSEALYAVMPLMVAGTAEAEIKETLEFVFRSCGGEVAFDSIVAAGKNAAVLHYHRAESKLKRGDMVLLDCGAALGGYASDISRTIPVHGEFTDQQLIVYEAVHKAQRAAIKAVRPGVPISVIYRAAALELITGLKRLGLLKGSSSSLYKQGKFKEFFPHGIGHSLGLDVHDVGELRGNNQAVLSEGMVITIEPGLYFSKQFKQLPACGVRIEDDVLVTRNGARILSEGFPKDAHELIGLFQ